MAPKTTTKKAPAKVVKKETTTKKAEPKKTVAPLKKTVAKKEEPKKTVTPVKKTTSKKEEPKKTVVPVKKSAPKKEESKKTVAPAKKIVAKKEEIENKITELKTPVMSDFPTAKKGDKNGNITLIQMNLSNRGYDIGPGGIDGVFGNDLLAAVKEFQKDIGMPVPNGIVGPKTWKALQESKVIKIKSEPVSVTNNHVPASDPIPEPAQTTVPVMAIPDQQAVQTVVYEQRMIIDGLTRFQADVLMKLFNGSLDIKVQQVAKRK